MLDKILALAVKYDLYHFFATVATNPHHFLFNDAKKFCNVAEAMPQSNPYTLFGGNIVSVANFWSANAIREM